MEQANPATVTPNDMYRRVRRIYVGSIAVAMPLLFFSLVTAVNNIGGGVLAALLLVAGVGVLVLGLLARSSARCPRCQNSLMWKSAAMGMGHVSLSVKARCPKCDLDLEQPWQLEAAPSEAER